MEAFLSSNNKTTTHPPMVIEKPTKENNDNNLSTGRGDTVNCIANQFSPLSLETNSKTIVVLQQAKEPTKTTAIDTKHDIENKAMPPHEQQQHQEEAPLSTDDSPTEKLQPEPALQKDKDDAESHMDIGYSQGLVVEESISPSQPMSQSLTQTQIELTQMDSSALTPSDHFMMNECSSSSKQQIKSQSPPPPMPWGRLIPCLPSITNAPVDLLEKNQSYWMGRSSTKCEIPILVGKTLSKKETEMMAWAHSMISNRHCRIFLEGGDMNSDVERYDMETTTSSTNPNPNPVSSAVIILEDHSGNGTYINQTTQLQKLDRRILHSGDEICLVNAHTLRKKIPSARVVQAVMQQYSYIFVQSNKPRKAMVNPRAMNYHHLQHPNNPQFPPSNFPFRNNNHHNTTNNNPSASLAAVNRYSSRRIEAHYDIREVLGDGTSGQVRRAIHRQTGKEYAVKVISLRGQSNTKSMEQEVSLLHSLDHPYIVQLVDVFVHYSIAMYLVMELVAGGDLFDRIVAQQRYTEVDARRVMRRLLSALHYLHETKNIVHRDLKPENILCASPTHVKLADFGLAKIIQSDGLKTFCGTPQYFAPEVLERRHTKAGSGRYGKPADMWSLGVILFILLVGRPPFDADLPTELYATMDFFAPDDQDENPIDWSCMPEAHQLIQQLLRMDPKRRLSVQQACDHPWININDGDTHVHPLDDPAVVTARKRLFSEANNKISEEDEDKPVTMEGEETASSSSLGDEEEILNHDGSVTSKDSSLSRESFLRAATAPSTGHQRGESFLLETTTESSPNFDGNEDDNKELTEKDSNMDMDKTAHDQEQKQDVDKNTKRSSKPNTPVESKSTSPEGDLAMATEFVTPDEGNTPPRSPLAGLNLNKRSNRFREQVLRHTSPATATTESPEGSSKNNRHRCIESATIGQMTVTPTASNTRGQMLVNSKDSPSSPSGRTHQVDGGEEEDPILSQFSSACSSLESFPSPNARSVTNPTNTKKRNLGEDQEEEDPSPLQPDAKRPRAVGGSATTSTSTKTKRQMTLSSFFKKKQV